jgi:uncharacterized protein YdeI (BOF family)
MRFLRFILIALLFSVAIISCQKDQSADLTQEKTVAVKADTSNTSGNFLAVKGNLNVTVGDSTYSFDAAQDSIAFINVNIDSNKYFGITAINKQHTISFGISSPGFASPGLTNTIAGSQFLFSADNKLSKEYSLVKTAGPSEVNQINLVNYMQDSVLTKGTFTTVMMNKDGKQEPSTVKGSFNLLIK